MIIAVTFGQKDGTNSNILATLQSGRWNDGADDNKQMLWNSILHVNILMY